MYNRRLDECFYKRTVDPAEEPVTTAEAKAHLNITLSDDDTLIGSLIVAAREMAEDFTRRAFVTQTWQLNRYIFPGSEEILLPYPDLQSVSSIQYIDEDGDTQTLTASTYTVDTVANRVFLNYDQDWPSTRTIQNAVTITYVTGYGDPADVPQAIKQAILLLVGEMYENREETGPTSLYKLPLTSERLLATYKDMRF